MKINKLFEGMNISASGLSAQRKKMNAIASNMANAETTKTEDGSPYRRKVVTFHSSTQKTFSNLLQSSDSSLAATDPNHFTQGFQTAAGGDVSGGVVTEETTDQGDLKEVYDPSHPDADENGYVEMPNVNVISEMVDMVTASRAYEANVTAVDAAKTIAKGALEI
jgi:flagellar basal-body rod protein FlgC